MGKEDIRSYCRTKNMKCSALDSNILYPNNRMVYEDEDWNIYSILENLGTLQRKMTSQLTLKFPLKTLQGEPFVCLMETGQRDLQTVPLNDPDPFENPFKII